MLTLRQTFAYADFFARIPGVLVFIFAMSFADEWLTQRRNP